MLTRKLTYAALLMSLACTSRAQPSEAARTDTRPAKVEPKAEPTLPASTKAEPALPPSTADASVQAVAEAGTEPTFAPGRYLFPGRSRHFYEVVLCPEGTIRVREEEKRASGTYEREGTKLHVKLGKKKVVYELKPNFKMLRGPAGKWLELSGPAEGCEP